jgi:chromosome segregation ATPase
MEAEFKQELLNKDKEINELTEELNQYKQRNELLLTEYETYKSDITNEINIQRQLHQSEVNSLLDKIKIGEKFKNLEDNGEAPENIMQIKNELDSTRRNVTELNNEIDKLRHDKELLTIEKNEYKINLVKIRDSQNFNQKTLEAELNKSQNIIENMQREINDLQNVIKDREYQINDLIKQQENLNGIINNYQMNYQEMENMVKALRGMIETKEEDFNTKISEKEKANQEKFIKERKEKENYQKQIEELNIKLREAKSDDMIQKENEINKLKEEIRAHKKEMQYDSNSKSYKELANKLKIMTEKKK